jgi:dTDP-4-dehydrorhamnose 3,5-epimerase
MRFRETSLAGAFLIEPERMEDARGFFARTWCVREFAAQGLSTDLVQCNVSFNARAGTLRGMHYQVAPHAEIKLVRCPRGAIFDAIVDVRADSPTFGRWLGFELSAENGQMLYIPEGFAHGFQTLSDDSEVAYQMSTFYDAESARGLRWDDSTVGIEWPLAESRILSDRDREFPGLGNYGTSI